MIALLARLRQALSGLTTRGRSFLSAGVASALCALLLRQQDLLRIAVLLAALPIGCALMLGQARYRLSLARIVAPARVSPGETVRVRLELQNLSRLSTRMVLAEDRVPYVLGAPPRFVLDRLPPGQQAAVTYSLRTQLRGRYPVGPLRLRVVDPFGLCELTRSFTATDPVIVVPKLWPLHDAGGGGLWSGAGDSVTRAAAASGENDVAVREYRQGDDLRRVHWRSTARRGELMVRREEQPRQMRATVLLDVRPSGHRGEGPASSFEWAVSAAASAGVHFTERRFAVRLLLDEHPAPWSNPHTGEAAGRLLDQLAVLQLDSDHALGGAIGALRRGGGDGIVVAVLGEVAEPDAMELARLGREGMPGVALLLRTGEWTALPPRLESEVEETRERVARILVRGGWRVATAGPADTVTSTWGRAVAVPLGARGSARQEAGLGTRGPAGNGFGSGYGVDVR